MISLADQSQPRGYPSLSVHIRKSYKNREVHVGVRPALRRARMGVPPRERVLPWRGYVSVSVQTDDYKLSISPELLICKLHRFQLICDIFFILFLFYLYLGHPYIHQSKTIKFRSVLFSYILCIKVIDEL